MGSSGTACCKERSCSRTRSRTSRRACTWRWSTRESEAAAAPWRCDPATAGSSSGPTTGCSSPRPRSWAGSRPRTRSRTRPTCSTASRRRSTGATSSRRRRRISWTGSRSKIEPESLVWLEVPKPDVTHRRIRASCLYVDRFGNMQLNLTRKDLETLAPEPGTRVELEIASERYYAVTARTFADARDGEIIVYEDAYGNIAIAISGGSAAGTFYSAEPGVDVLIRVAD